jgi:multiple sugar transport system permease protein
MTANEAAPPPAAAGDGLVKPPANPAGLRSLGRQATANALLGLFGVVFLLPMAWLVFASVDARASWSIEVPHLTGHNFADALSGGSLQSIISSIVMAGVATVVATACAAPAAYALSRRRIPWKGPLLLGVLFLSGVPLAILVIPVFQMFSTIGWLSLLPCSLFLAVTCLPFEIYLIKNFFDAVPRDVEEAARMERASTFQILTRVVGPLALPGIGAAAIYGFVTAWGSFLVPLVLITDPTQQPGSIAIFGFIGNAYVRYGDIAAFSLIYAVPIFLLYALSSRLFRGGFVLSGAVKG